MPKAQAVGSRDIVVTTRSQDASGRDILVRCALVIYGRVSSSPAMPAQLLFEQVFQLYGESVYRYCLSQVREPSLAEDIAADTFERAWKAFERVKPEAEWVRAWLFRIAKNRVVSHQRRSTKFANIIRGLGRTESQAVASVENDVTIREELRLAIAAIASLKVRDRQLIGLRVGAGLSYSDIGAILDMPPHSAEVATRRAIEKVRAAVEVER